MNSSHTNTTFQTPVSITMQSDDLPGNNAPQTMQGVQGMNHPPLLNSADLLSQIKGLYRLLDLYPESGSDGLVDKIIIDQQSLSKLINDISPGAYHSLTRIDFASLDLKMLHVLGVYGSKSEIIHFLRSTDAIDDRIATYMLTSPSHQTTGSSGLRSGLYLLLPEINNTEAINARRAFAIYWPEETTWDDHAISAVRKNRVAFMRYLTKLADQLVALISPEHAEKLVWNDGEPVGENASSLAERNVLQNADTMVVSRRLFKFEVVVKKDQDEVASISPGFVLEHDTIQEPLSEDQVSIKPHLATRFIASGSRVAFITAKEMRSETRIVPFDQSITMIHLKSQLKLPQAIHIGSEVTLDGWKILLTEGDLQARDKAQSKKFLSGLLSIERLHSKLRNEALDKMKDEMNASASQLKRLLWLRLMHQLRETYPLIQIKGESTSSATHPSDQGHDELLRNLTATYPTLGDKITEACKRLSSSKITSQDYGQLKTRLLAIKHFITCETLSTAHQDALISSILKLEVDISNRHSLDSIMGTGHSPKPVARPQLKWPTIRAAWDFVSGTSSTSSASEVRPDALKALEIPNLDQNDAEFLMALETLKIEDSRYLHACSRITEAAEVWAAESAEQSAVELIHNIQKVQVEQFQAESAAYASQQQQKMRDESFTQFKSDFQKSLVPEKQSTHPPVTINHIAYTANKTYYLEGHKEYPATPCTTYKVEFLELTKHDRELIRQDPNHIPSPCVGRGTSVLDLQLDDEIKMACLVGPSKILLIVQTASHFVLCLGEQRDLKGLQHVKRIPRDQESQYHFAMDEAKRNLAVAYTDNKGALFLQHFVIDESFSTIMSRGSYQDISRWYSDSIPRLRMAVFVAGTDELCIVEESNRMRIYSFISQSFRPADVRLANTPEAIFSTPDGSALVVVERSGESGFYLRSFYISTFGASAEGSLLGETVVFDGCTSFLLTCFENRGTPHLLALSPSKHSIESRIIRISKKTSEFQFQSKNRRQSKTEQTVGEQNALIDCFSEVWTRYPVIPAISRNPISPETRLPRSVLFVTNSNAAKFEPYFRRMVQQFEATTHKITKGTLTGIVILSHDFAHFLESTQSVHTISGFRSGEWLVELLCLIPIHIAITKDNRFVPLKNGVIDPQFEVRLLGAEVPQIVDAITLVWYESIFNSYLATKPVKVISSMGEQSVGKSYALNHIVDSSFAGSAVRTTEGVWLSLCPTQDALVVALDFEGVHSIERTAQEDMLLVLFNSAISNMVLFRNNFVLSRDIANMFSSFQASTTLLDPAANPRLFKGLLTIIIKDVVDSDRDEIVHEFESKLSNIVIHEGGSNFLSVLHANQMDIIPWPVIQSGDFYHEFSTITGRFAELPRTHGSAGEFLLLLKTLMAKLKAQDWGAMDQNLAKHRVEILLSLLNTAVSTGLAEVEPQPEPLVNIDNQISTPDCGDGQSRFCVIQLEEPRQEALQSLISAWKPDAARHDVALLEEYLHHLAEARISHVREWLSINVQRFPADNADVRKLNNVFESLSDTLRSGVQICRSQCSECHLFCILVRGHTIGIHNCGTSHRCLDSCDFDHPQSAQCSLPAGHSSRHMCQPWAHSCGEPCDLDTKRGCQKLCDKTPDHTDQGHRCSARDHLCGESCDLKGIVGPESIIYDCPETCTVPYDAVHIRHTCEKLQSCPIKCELCNRLCALGDHFHGLEAGEKHLCGQRHPCSFDCMYPGICEIKTAPNSVESTYRGLYDVFQYTKYTQVAQRLSCAIPIEPGERSHAGDHVHTKDANPFHFCDAKCKDCSYICTLPLGHTQAEHDTAHGSMEETFWAVEGDQDAVIELSGNRFGPQDSGISHLCNQVCGQLGRHVHIDYCRMGHHEENSLHVDVPLAPHPELPKDWVSHSLHWKRSGFRDPYSRDLRDEFGRCDSQCAGPDHGPTSNPSYCTLPIFHPPQPLNWGPTGSQGHVSSDGHLYGCPDPEDLRAAYHVIFVLDISTSMSNTDRRPLANTPVTSRIAQQHNNRFGAVLSALHSFWTVRDPRTSTNAARKDAYTCVLFGGNARVHFENDLSSNPNDLLSRLLTVNQYEPSTRFHVALRTTQSALENSWRDNLAPVVIFLSDGEGSADDSIIYDLCNKSVALGQPLSLHAISFGKSRYTSSLRRMVEIASDVARNVRRDQTSHFIECSYNDANDTVRLAETFLNIAASLQKPRAALINRGHTKH